MPKGELRENELHSPAKVTIFVHSCGFLGCFVQLALNFLCFFAHDLLFSKAFSTFAGETTPAFTESSGESHERTPHQLPPKEETTP